MDRFTERLGNFSVAGLDTSIFIYHFEENPKYPPLIQSLFTNIEKGKLISLISSITLMEILVRPFAVGRQDIARKYEAILVNFPNLKIVDLYRGIVRLAAQLRAKYRIRPPDALQLAACLNHHAQAFVTNDRILERLRDRLEIIILDDFIGSRISKAKNE